MSLMALVIGGSLLAGCGRQASMFAKQYDASVATEWFDLYLELVQNTPGFTPPVAARAFGYAGVTLYEAIVPGMPEYQSLAGQLNELPELPQPESGVEYHWPTVANSALAGVTRQLFANAATEGRAAIDALEERFASQFGATLDPAVFKRSAARGQAVADAVFSWSMADGGHEGYLANFPSDFSPIAGPGKWIPTPPKFSNCMLPHWGANRPFVLESGKACAPGAPPPYSEDPASGFFAQAKEVYDTVSQLTPEQMEIATFWADNAGETATPPGHSISIASQVLKEASLAEAAETYAKVGIAVADAFIACWNTKYEYSLLRPVSYIQQVIDPSWTSPIVTPPFPEYTSGHSVQSAAAAQVLTDLFGDSYAFADHTHDARGLAPRTFESFFGAADEAAISRLYGGIHFRAAIENGLEQGKCIGQKVSAIEFRK